MKSVVVGTTFEPPPRSPSSGTIDSGSAGLIGSRMIKSAAYCYQILPIVSKQYTKTVRLAYHSVTVISLMLAQSEPNKRSPVATVPSAKL